jgi:hypothetical protein
MVDAITTTNFFISDPIRFCSLRPVPSSRVPCFMPQCQCSNATSKYFCGAVSKLLLSYDETAALNMIVEQYRHVEKGRQSNIKLLIIAIRFSQYNGTYP